MKDARLYPQLLHLLRMVMTSSPPFPILRARDDARALMDERGAQLLEQTVARCDALRAKVNAMPSLACPRMDDPTRIVVDVSGRGLTGFHAAPAKPDHFQPLEQRGNHRLPVAAHRIGLAEL